MNIAFFCDAYKPTRNGVAVSVETTADELRARGHRVVIFAPRYRGYQDDSADVVRFHAGHWFRAKDFPVARPTLARLNWQAWVRFQREKFDVVHSHSPFTLGCVGARWARRHNIPVVFTFHTLYHHYLHYVPMPKEILRPYLFWRVRNFCYLADHIIVPSRPVGKIVSRFRPGAALTVLPTGIDIKKFSHGNRHAARARHHIGSDEIVLLYVGRIVLEKNLVFLLRALAPLLGSRAKDGQAHPRVRLMLVGGGPATESLQQLCQQLNIHDEVLFTDFIEPDVIADYYAAGDIFTFASRTETQGVSIAEALAAGLPCVVVGVMGAAESLTHEGDGFVVPPREERFRDAVARLINDPALRAHMGTQARHNVLMLTRERSVSKLLDVYQSLSAR